MFYLSIFFVLLSIVQPSKLARSDIPDLQVISTSESRQGIIKLEWKANADVQGPFELQQDLDPAFTSPVIVYLGYEKGTFISGLPNGIYHYRLKAENENWSDTRSVEIKHYSLNLALSLMAIGAIVFFITLGLIWQSSKTKTE